MNSLFLTYDYLVGMDSANIRNMRRIAGGDDEGKISLLLDHSGSGRDVADPWYTGDFEATYCDVTIDGRGGHGSRPDQSVNPIDAFWAIYGGLPSLRVQKIDPFKTLTYSVGKVTAGTASNIIPQTCTFAGSMRTFDHEGVGAAHHNQAFDIDEDVLVPGAASAAAYAIAYLKNDKLKGGRKIGYRELLERTGAKKEWLDELYGK